MNFHNTSKKRIKMHPSKNIKDFCGQPIIAYSIRTAQESRLFNRIIVSTDDDEEEIAKRGVRSERALKLALAEMYVQGVSTRKVVKVTEELCGFEISSSEVSRAIQALGEPNFLVDCYQPTTEKGGLVVEFPNDFSVVQKELRRHGIVDKDSWVAFPILSVISIKKDYAISVK